MQALTEATARIEALRQAMLALDPPAAAMLLNHLHSVRELSSVLRECSIQLKRPEIRSRANDSLCDRIDLALGTVPRPVCQVDGS